MVCRRGVYGQAGGQGDEARLGELRRRHGAPGLRLKCTAFVPQLARNLYRGSCALPPSHHESTHSSEARNRKIWLPVWSETDPQSCPGSTAPSTTASASTGRRPPEARVSKEDHAVRGPRARTLASIAGRGPSAGGRRRSRAAGTAARGSTISSGGRSSLTGTGTRAGGSCLAPSATTLSAGMHPGADA